MTNDFESGHRGRARFFRKSWTPDCFVSGKVKLLKFIKTYSVINITIVYTEIFPILKQKNDCSYPPKTGIVKCDV